MQTDELLLRRLHNQHLLSHGGHPAANLCGLQAQFLRNAIHALRIRSDAVNTENLIKTWTLRGTVHLIPENDLPLYIRHCGSAKDVCQSGWYQWTAARGQANPPQREAALAQLALDAIAEGADDREAIRLRLRNSGMAEQEEARVFNPWGGLIAELANIGAIAFRVDIADHLHPVETKRYRLLQPFTPLEENAAHLELARRYFTHYGPATLRDAAYFFHWTQAELKALLPYLPVETVVLDGRTHYFIPNGEPERDMPDCLLLAGFDPLMMGYRKEDNHFLPSDYLRDVFNLAGIVHPSILLHGRVAGKWKEKDGKAELTAFKPLSAMDRKRITEEVTRLFAPKKIMWT